MRHWLERVFVVSTLFLVCLSGSDASAKGRFTKGKMAVGLGAGGGPGVFEVSGSFGYFVIDKLRPDVAVAYRYENHNPGTVQQLQTNLGLRYYLIDANPISPFVVGQLGYIHREFSGDVYSFLKNNPYDYYSVAGGGGAHIAMSRNFGLEVIAGVIKYLSVDAELLAADSRVTEDVSFWWNLGFSVVF